MKDENEDENEDDEVKHDWSRQAKLTDASDDDDLV